MHPVRSHGAHTHVLGDQRPLLGTEPFDHLRARACGCGSDATDARRSGGAAASRARGWRESGAQVSCTHVSPAEEMCLRAFGAGRWPARPWFRSRTLAAGLHAAWMCAGLLQ